MSVTGAIPVSFPVQIKQSFRNPGSPGDVVRTISEMGLFIVADGGGAGNSPQLASKTAVDTIVEMLKRFEARAPSADLQTVMEAVNQAFQAASKAIHQLIPLDPQRKEMNSTLDLVWVRGNAALIAHTGDGRIYQLRQDRDPGLLTYDHTWAMTWVREGSKTAAEAAKALGANNLLHALGKTESVWVEFSTVQLQSGDRFLMCTDGLYRKIEGSFGQQLKSLTASGDPGVWVEKLESMARQGGSTDDLSCLVIQYLPEREKTALISPSDCLDAIKKTRFFRGFSHLHQTQLQSLALPRVIPAGMVVAKEDEPSQVIWIVLSGQLEIWRNGKLIAIREEVGSTLGESVLIEDARRSATVKAKTEVRLLEFSGKVIREFLDRFMENPAAVAYREMFKADHERLVTLTKEVADR